MGAADFFKNVVKPTKMVVVDVPVTAVKGIGVGGSALKDIAYDGPKLLKKTAFSKKGALILAGIIGAFAAAKGIASWSNKNKEEETQMLGAQIGEAGDLRASIEANRAARVETSMAMGESGSLPYRSDWRSREKGGLPNLPPTV
jgi:hypothetical protein